MIELDPDLNSSCVPLAWLLGRWEGVGVGEDPATGSYRFGQELVVGHDGRAFLSYDSASWVLDDQGGATAPGPRETGWVRPVAAADTVAHDTELLLAHPDGIVELYLGRLSGARLELGTDAVVRTPDAPGRAAAQRLYGLVESDLLWAWDAGSDGRLGSVMSARLRRVGAAPAPVAPEGLAGGGPTLAG